MPNPRNQAMLVRAATLYYLEGKSQAEVAAAIGLSRSNVSRVLADARRHGIVDIRINDPHGRATELEIAVEKKYHLRECRITPSASSEGRLQRVGALGAQWLVDNVPEEGQIALSWGSTVQAVVDEIPDVSAHPRLEVLPLVGGLSIVDSARDGNVLVRLLANKLGAKHRRLYAPAVVESLESREAFLREPSISGVLDASRKAQIALVGIGSVGAGASSAIIESMNLSAAESKAFAASGAIGDCCTRFFDARGELVESVVNDRVIAIDLPDLKGIPTVVGVAAGANKARSTHAALIGGLVDILICDTELAEAMLELPAS
jgi:DNA-binding transcriptional regulator LsrR (DeoR family)